MDWLKWFRVWEKSIRAREGELARAASRRLPAPLPPGNHLTGWGLLLQPGASAQKSAVSVSVGQIVSVLDYNSRHSAILPEQNPPHVVLSA